MPLYAPAREVPKPRLPGKTEEDLLTSLSPKAAPRPLPDDEVLDAELDPDTVVMRATERCPTRSAVTEQEAVPETLREAFTQNVQRQFRATLAAKDPRTLAKLDQPFGKENLKQTFHSEAALRHVLLPLWKSGFLCGCSDDWEALCSACYPARLPRALLNECGTVKFHGIRGFHSNWEDETTVNQDRAKMATAALLHFGGSVADLVRWMGGPHVGEQRDHARTINLLKSSGVDPDVVANLERMFFDGTPAYCNAESDERNFLAYYLCGNHSTVDEEPEKTYKAMVKDNKKGCTILFDKRVVLFMLHGHLTPQGVVDLCTLFKNPRPTFDSSFRPYVWCHATNDWTTKDTEPPLTFASAELNFMIWLYNLRITYPHLEMHIADDDVSGAFRLIKYHPNLMAMHASIQSGCAVVNTGGTFGDNTSPSNFDPIGLARRQRAAAIWKSDEDVESRVLPHLPPLVQAPPPTDEEASAFRPADKDAVNTGVLDEHGERLPPPCPMHVDDAMHADVGPFLVRTICASVGALFDVLGTPELEDPRVPGVLSSDKFEAHYNHLRKCVGRRFNSRELTVGMLPHKREQLLTLLKEWDGMVTFQLQEIAHLLGTLENHARYARWVGCWCFALQNSARNTLHVRHQILQRRYCRSSKEREYERQLPPQLWNRLSTLIARDRALLLWNTRQRFPVSPAMKAAIAVLLRCVTDTDSPWETPIGMVTPREPHFNSRGDASLIGGGAYCPGLRFWFDMSWSAGTLDGIHHHKPSSPWFVHINALEFIVVILQFAAILTRLDAITEDDVALYFPRGRPDIPVWLGETDNTVSKSWENRATARTSQGQGLVAVYAEMLRIGGVNTQCNHLEGKKNIVADDVSRNDFSLNALDRSEKLFHRHPCLRSYDCFLPSQDLPRLLSSRLYSGPSSEPCVLPTVLGQFVPAGCTAFGSVSS